MSDTLGWDSQYSAAHTQGSSISDRKTGISAACIDEHRIRIAVCDDDAEDRKTLVQCITRDNPKVDTLQFCSGEELLAYDGRIDLVFLDVLMDPPNGMETARALRARDRRPLLVFVSCSQDFACAGYEVEAFRYLMKPVDPAVLGSVLDAAMRRIRSQRLVLKVAGGTWHVPYDEIRYAEAQGRNSKLCVGDRIVTVPLNIGRLTDMLPQELFFRCSRSFVVNLQHVRRVRRYQATLSNGDTVAVGRAMLPELQKRLMTVLTSPHSL